MSFRLFIYYCALCGGWAALVGFFLGLVSPQSAIASAGAKGLFLGMCIALALGLVDAIFVLGGRRFGQIIMRVGSAVLLGCVGGMIGGMLGQWLLGLTNVGLFFVLGWTFTGLLVGASIGVFEMLDNVLREKNLGVGMRVVLLLLVILGTLLAAVLGVLGLAFNNGILVSLAAFFLVTTLGVALLLSVILGKEFGKDLRSSRAKLIKCLTGGAVGGLLGGVIALALKLVYAGVFTGKDPDTLWSPTATGFVALGMCIGLLVGLAQVILKEAWIKVEAGFRPGRELILAKELTTIGRGEGCDLGLFGDMECEKMHARIVLTGHQYYVEDTGTPGGTFVNDHRVNGRSALKNGDVIRVGKSLLRFRERAKKK